VGARPDDGPAEPLKRAAAVLCAALAAGPLAAQTAGEIAAVRAQATAAYDAKDYPSFLAHSRKLLALDRLSIRARYNLACALALSGRAEEATAVLRALAEMELAFDIEADTDFASLREREDFRAIAARMKALAAPRGTAAVAFTLPEADLITEGIAHDPKTGAFFVSSVHRRKIVRVAKDGTVADFTKDGEPRLLGMGALAADPVRRALWASSSASAAMDGFVAARAERPFVVELDLDNGRERRRLEAPPDAPDAELSDLAVSASGDLYVADPRAGRIYVLRAGAAALRTLVPAGAIRSAQGIAIGPEGTLFVADYAQGVAVVDTKTGASRLLEAPGTMALSGIDGLVWADGALVAVQNGIRPHRVVRIDLDAARAHAAGLRVLAMNHPDFDEPTLGVMVGRDFYFVANSQYRRVGADGTLDRAHLRPPVVLKTAIGR
jgi:sugar lactone lactonase YvrE